MTSKMRPIFKGISQRKAEANSILGRRNSVDKGQGTGNCAQGLGDVQVSWE